MIKDIEKERWRDHDNFCVIVTAELGIIVTLSIIITGILMDRNIITGGTFLLITAIVLFLIGFGLLIYDSTNDGIDRWY